jgi:hypothetical protein
MAERASSGETLAAAGELLFGKRWQRPLARAVRHDERQIWRWVTGQYLLHPRHWVFHRLRRILRERAMACGAEAERLDRWLERLAVEQGKSAGPRSTGTCGWLALSGMDAARQVAPFSVAAGLTAQGRVTIPSSFGRITAEDVTCHATA